MEFIFECQGCDTKLKAWTTLKSTNEDVFIMVQPCPKCTQVAREQGRYETELKKQKPPEFFRKIID